MVDGVVSKATAERRTSSSLVLGTMNQVNAVDPIKYSAALQKFLGYNKEEADHVACDFNLKRAKGIIEPLRCYPDPTAYYKENKLYMPNGKFFKDIDFNILGIKPEEEDFKNFVTEQLICNLGN
jgi:hypothetical protein